MTASLTEQVLYNCDVSDARHAGIYSICGLALRLRDLFKWERQMPPWLEGAPGEVLDWIGRKEEIWETLLESDYRPLTIDGRGYDPFDTRAINAVVSGQGLFYGAGYAHSLKPTFFLARIRGRQSIEGRTIWHLGRELARDLLTLPAFSQDDEIVLRAESAAVHLWDQIAYIGNSGRPALAYALQACCGIADTEPKTVRDHFDRILAAQQLLHLRHELSELEENVFERALWRRMISDFPHTPVELADRTARRRCVGALHGFRAGFGQSAVRRTARRLCRVHGGRGLGWPAPRRRRHLSPGGPIQPRDHGCLHARAGIRRPGGHSGGHRSDPAATRGDRAAGKG